MGVKFWLLFIGLCGCLCKTEGNLPIQPGIMDFNGYRSLLEGKRVALAANQTSVVTEYALAGKHPLPSGSGISLHTLDFLRQKGINVVKIFCPEHGFRGEADAGEAIGNNLDSRTGLPIVSLYGDKKKPAPEDLKNIDAVVFDMQDVGVRFYTYLSTLHYLMEACAENDLPLLVMDRPNPNAFYLDGPLLEPRYRSFIGMHPVPIVYGMSIGEYARMINGEHWLQNGIQCRLQVIPCKNWSREQVVELPCKPSPNLPDRISVMLYPSVCLFEGTVVSEGRGTYTPFQVFGHPALEHMPYRFTPASIPGMSKNPKCLGKVCYGMNLKDKFEETKQGKKLRLDWLLTAYRNYKGKEAFFIPFFHKLAGTAELQKAIETGKSENEIRASWQADLEHFREIRAKYLIYGTNSQN